MRRLNEAREIDQMRFGIGATGVIGLVLRRDTQCVQLRRLRLKVRIDGCFCIGVTTPC